MSVSRRLDELLRTCKVVRIVGKVVFMSDGHWGDGGPADDSQRLEDQIYVAMLWFAGEGYTFVILGDEEDTWEQKDRKKIMVTHWNLWALRESLIREGRWFEVEGNHNSGLGWPEALLLELDGGLRVFCAHWHQLDWLNYQGSWLAKFFVRYIWVPLQWFFGAKDPTTAVKSKNPKKHEKVRLKAREWARTQDVSIFAGGHTHSLEVDLEAKIVNAGSGVGKEVEAITIVNGKVETKVGGIL